MRYKEWEGILSAVDEEAGLNKDNVIEKIGEKLQKECPTVYKEWEEDNFNVDRLFGSGIFVIKQTLLHLAAENGHANIVNALLEKGANVNVENSCKSTPLHLAAINGHLDVVKTLLTKDAAVNAIDVDGWTPLHWAARNGHLEIVNALLAKDSNVNAIDIDGWTALHFAAGECHIVIVNALLTAEKIDVNAVDKNGNTPLHLAALSGNIDVAKALLAKGANPLLKNNNGQTPRDLTNDDEIKQLLKEKQCGKPHAEDSSSKVGESAEHPTKAIEEEQPESEFMKAIAAGSATAALGTAMATYLFVNGIIAVEAMSIALAVVAIAAVALAVGGVTYKALQPSSKVSAAQTLGNQSSIGKDAAQLP